ncbi:MAG: hypothetical protein N3I35_06740 [Clostridia bacterium]|nr:hypothetical protein [Clostridia bacterium]
MPVRKPIQLEQPPPPVPEYLRLGQNVPFSGINLKNDDSAISDGQTPYGAKNYNLDDGGKPAKRKGLTYVYTSSLGSGQINGLYKDEYNGKKVFAWNTKLYTQIGTSAPVEIMSGLSNTKGYFYVFNDILYYKNGVDFVKVTSSHVASSALTGAYIPTLTVSTPPTGGGTTNESRNLIQPGFKQKYNGDGSSTAYTIIYTLLDATTITATANGVAKTEGVDFSVNRTTGILTFNVAPVSGTNNVEITAYKTFSGDADKIIKATRATLYGGGTNDSRIFICGNSEYPNVYWYTGLTGSTNYDATYYPEFNFNRIGSDNKAISNWSYLYSSLIALKEDGVYKITYSSSSGSVTFPVSILNRQVGCDMPDSVQIIQDSPVFGNTVSGLHRIVPTYIESEKNVASISSLINGRGVTAPGLLDHDINDLQNCTSVDDGQKYYLIVGDVAYVWDYELSPFTGNQNNLIWYYYTGINANCWAFIQRVLYYGDRTNGYLVKFQDNKNDFGNAINAIWRSKLFDFNAPERLKDVTQIWLTTKALGGTALTINYFDENNTLVESAIVTASETNSYSWSKFSWSAFTWYVTKYAPVIRKRPKLKKIKYFQIEIQNNEVNQDLSIIKLVIEYLLKGKVK